MVLRWGWAVLLFGLQATAASGTVGTDSTYLLLNGKRAFVIGAYDLPSGVTLDDFRNAGFNLLLETSGVSPLPWPADPWRAARLPLAVRPDHPVDALIDMIDNLESRAGLVVWHGPDEPAWQSEPVPPSWLAQGRTVVEAHDDYLGSPRPVWLNHAPRGTRAYPDSFDLLRPYCDFADIFSFDIYPIPASTGHSILPNSSISCVGEYTDILVDLLSDSLGRQLKPAWMVLQGFSWSSFDLMNEWYEADSSEYDFDQIARAAAGDPNGDGFTDLILLYSEGKASGGEQRIDVAFSQGTAFQAPEPWAGYQAEILSWANVKGCVCGHLSGDGLDDVVLWVSDDGTRAELKVFLSLGASFDSADTWLESSLPIFNSSRSVGFGLQDFDGDGLGDLVLATDIDTSGADRQGLWITRSLAGRMSPVEDWGEIPSSDIRFSQVLKFQTGDFTGDGLGDVAFLHADDGGDVRLSVASSGGSEFLSPICWWDTSSADFPPEDIFDLTAQDLNGDGRSDLLILYRETAHPWWPSWLVALLSDGTRFRVERWGVSMVGYHNFERHCFTLGGDFNGDGFGDVAAGYNFDVDFDDLYQAFEVAVSSGAGFGGPGPSYLESRFMAYDAVIHGATGIIYWGLWYTGGPYAIWKGVSKVASELSTLSNILAWDTVTGCTNANSPDVEFLVKESDGYHCLIAANRSDAFVDVAFSGPWIERVESFVELFENRIVSPSGTSLSDTFEPYDVHVYMARPFGRGPSPPGEIRIAPNPFSSNTRFGISTEHAGPLRVDIYDVHGHLVRHLLRQDRDAGLHIIDWDGMSSRGAPAPSGIYFCRFRVSGETSTRKVILLR